MPSYCGSGHLLEAGQAVESWIVATMSWARFSRAKKALAPYQEAKDGYCQVGSLHRPRHCEECARVEIERLEEGEVCLLPRSSGSLLCCRRNTTSPAFVEGSWTRQAV